MSKITVFSAAKFRISDVKNVIQVFFQSNPTVAPPRTHHSGQISSSERVACTRVSRPPRAALLQYGAGMHLTTARFCFLDARAFFDDARLDDVPDLRRIRFALPPSTACCKYASPASRAARLRPRRAFDGWVRLVSGGACDFADAARARGVLRHRCMIWPEAAANRTRAAQSLLPRPATPALDGYEYESTICV